MIIEVEKGRYQAARPLDNHLIRIGDTDAGKVSLLGACEILKNMGLQEAMWASWGTADRHGLKQETGDIGIEMPVGYFHIDIAPMHAALIGLNRPIKLKQAAEELTGRFYGAQHHADDDSFNAARILAEFALVVPYLWAYVRWQ